VESEWQASVIEPIEALLERWQERGDTEPVQILMPAWRANAGLTDEWFAVLTALSATLDSAHLPSDEADVLRAVSARIKRAVSHTPQ
jgi:hypothetical protein